MNTLWEHHDRNWRDPGQIASLWQDANALDPSILDYRAYGDWWETLAASAVTLIVTREYEHLVVALSSLDGRPHVSFLPIPHPSGVAVDRRRGIIHIASTRNPNQILDMVPARSHEAGVDDGKAGSSNAVLLPWRSQYLPGSLYIHDLALVGTSLHATAVGQNAVIQFTKRGTHEPVWWPRCIETSDGPIFDRNYLQLNSIAAGRDLVQSYFSASSDHVSFRRPGHRNFPVDRRGVIFSGATREPTVRGLTRPHSARLLKRQLWVANSGYGELSACRDGRAEPVVRLEGWTRGLSFLGEVAFVGTSRVIPRFRHYAPGLEIGSSTCGVHAVDTRTGTVTGGLEWPRGNQVFGVEWIPSELSSGFIFTTRNRTTVWPKKVFYDYVPQLGGPR